MHLALKPLTQCKILIVDDDEIIRFSLQAIMEDFFEVETLAMGLQALDYCKSNIPDLILLDVNLPDISGLDVCRALKQDICLRTFLLYLLLQLMILILRMLVGKLVQQILLINQ
ncbi:response regulator [Pseudoalteromonas sp. SG43-7]|nr:response regulator [Pseudoalteromonas sp. SG43-7]